MKRNIKDSKELVNFFYNYGRDLSVLITEMAGEGEFPYDKYDLEDFLNQCDDIAETINGNYDIRNYVDGEQFEINFYTFTPMDNIDDYDMGGELVGSAKFYITLKPSESLASSLQDAYLSRSF
jgi:hypothetical protein